MTDYEWLEQHGYQQHRCRKCGLAFWGDMEPEECPRCSRYHHGWDDEEEEGGSEDE